MILVIDNFDSFTYNLVQYIGEVAESEVTVYRNNQIELDQIKALSPSHIVISPGPGRPDDAGISKSVIQTFYKDIPILGVCLGHQSIGEVFGATVTYAPSIEHGKTADVFHDDQSPVYQSIPSPFVATRYHSLVIDESTLPSCLIKSSWTKDGVLMGIRHESYPLFGVQYHPESILTTQGKQIIKNFLNV